MKPNWRHFSAGIAVVVFALFAIVVLGLRAAARIDAADLGAAAWNGAFVTTERLKPVLDDALGERALAAWIMRQTAGASTVSTASPADDPPKIREAVDDMAKALIEARPRLGMSWSSDLGQLANVQAIRAKVHDYLRTAAKVSADEDRARLRPIAESIATIHLDSLNRSVPEWLAIVLPAEAVEGFLIGQNVKVTAAGKAPSETELAAARSRFVASVHAGVARSVSGRMHAAIVDAVERDLRFVSAQDSLVKAVSQDFAARWMWIITASIFLIAAVSAMLGAAWHVWMLGTGVTRVRLMAAYLIALVAGISVGLSIRGSLPPFLSMPMREFAGIYGVNAIGAATLINVATATSVAVLLVSSWGSFLIDTGTLTRFNVQLATLRWSFLAATFVLVSGVLNLYSYLQWPSASMAETAAAVVQSGAMSSAVAVGAAFSTLLLLIYLPGARVLVDEARRLKEEDPGQAAAIDGMLLLHGFDASAMQQIGRFATVLAPLLIAPLSGLISLITT